MEKPVLFGISGGNSFRDESQLHTHYHDFDIDYVHTEKYWMDWIMWSFEEVFDCTRLKMPGSDNANYGVWKIVFEKYLKKVSNKDLSIIAHSLGTTFILKYLSEHDLKIKQLHLMAPFVSDDFQPRDFNESTGTFTFDHKSVKDIASQCDRVHIWHSEDDDVCSPKHAKYLYDQIQNSELTTVKGRGHLNQSTFWELFEVLKANNRI